MMTSMAKWDAPGAARCGADRVVRHAPGGCQRGGRGAGGDGAKARAGGTTAAQPPASIGMTRYAGRTCTARTRESPAGGEIAGGVQPRTGPDAVSATAPGRHSHSFLCRPPACRGGQDAKRATCPPGGARMTPRPDGEWRDGVSAALASGRYGTWPLRLPGTTGLRFARHGRPRRITPGCPRTDARYGHLQMEKPGPIIGPGLSLKPWPA